MRSKKGECKTEQEHSQRKGAKGTLHTVTQNRSKRNTHTVTQNRSKRNTHSVTQNRS